MKRSRTEIPTKGGDEYDWNSRWRKMLHWKPGQGKTCKHSYNRRLRHSVKKGLDRILKIGYNG